MGLMGNSSGDEKFTTEDQYVMASLKRSIVELSDTCHRLLSFKMLNHDALVRVMELEVHCRRTGAAGICNRCFSRDRDRDRLRRPPR
ncbi:unnamed protein product [Ectocarpus sp. 6 AP-2014]